LLLETLCASFVVDSRVDGMFDASFLFGLLAIVPAIERANEVAGDAAEALEFISKVLVVGVVIFLGGLLGTIFEDKGSARLNEAANM
jgi:hypothetical protein